MRHVVNGLLLRGGQVLMALRSPYRRAYPGVWSFPGGHVEDGEALADALTRELREEIGVAPLAARALTRIDDGDRRFHLFAVDEWRGEPVNIGDEHAEIRWTALTKAAALSPLAFDAYREVFADLAKARRAQ